MSLTFELFVKHAVNLVLRDPNSNLITSDTFGKHQYINVHFLIWLSCLYLPDVSCVS